MVCQIDIVVFFSFNSIRIRPIFYLPGAVVAAVGVEAQEDEQQDGKAPQ